MNSHPKQNYVPLEALLTETNPQPEPDLLMQQVLSEANRDVRVRDMLGLMLVNLWVVAAKLLMPFFIVQHKKKSDIQITKEEK